MATPCDSEDTVNEAVFRESLHPYPGRSDRHGGPLSPVLSNVLRDELDKELEKRQHRFVRDADDFVIFVRSVRAGERVMQSIRCFLEKTLKLRVNEAKSHVRPTDHLEC